MCLQSPSSAKGSRCFLSRRDGTGAHYSRRCSALLHQTSAMSQRDKLFPDICQECWQVIGLLKSSLQAWEALQRRVTRHNCKTKSKQTGISSRHFQIIIFNSLESPIIQTECDLLLTFLLKNENFFKTSRKKCLSLNISFYFQQFGVVSSIRITNSVLMYEEYATRAW